MPYGSLALDTISTSGNLTVEGNVAVSSNITAGADLFVSGSQVKPLVLGTAKTATGTAVDFTDIPVWSKRITLMFSGVSTSATSNWLIQLGTDSGIENTGYLGVSGFYGTSTNGANYTTGFGLFISGADRVAHGTIVITQLSSSTNTWTCSGSLGITAGAAGFTCSSTGAKSLASILTQLRLTTVNGTDTFDAGTVNIMYE